MISNTNPIDFIVYSSYLQSIEEALKPSQYRKFVKGWDKSKWDKLFKTQPYEKDRNAFRIYIPLETTGDSEILPDASIVQSLSIKGYEIQDYKLGLAKEKNGKRVMKIGKLLSDSPDVLKKFATDPARSSSKKKQLVVISRHPYDIAGMSTDRGWTSCMNLVTGSNKHFVPIEIKEGSIIAYLIDETDKDIKKPIARILIKPFFNIERPEEVALGIQDKVYGTASKDFTNTVKKWVNSVNVSMGIRGVFQINTSIYNDSKWTDIRTIGLDQIYYKKLGVLENAKVAVDYAKNILKNKFPEGEYVIATDAKSSVDYAISVLKGERFELGEPAIAKVYPYNISYTIIVLKGERFEKAEPFLARYAEQALKYASVIRQPFPEGEAAIAKDKSVKAKYIKMLKSFGKVPLTF